MRGLLQESNNQIATHQLEMGQLTDNYTAQLNRVQLEAQQVHQLGVRAGMEEARHREWKFASAGIVVIIIAAIIVIYHETHRRADGH